MANLGKAYVQIIPKAEGITDKLKETISPSATQAGTAAGGNFVGGLKKVIAGAAIGSTVIAGFKTALDAGGKLQQSYGGLDTLYEDASDAAKEYAAQAAKAGISANSYAEQAVSFGAGLKKAFGGDTAKAAEAANTAILDMADNAAKMGTPLESIQNAYQGFAKGNYTMLDNLKLGYGGTKSEMERLLADATKLTGVKYDMNNLGDVYSAIHAIQGDLGLTGVAAEEASTTFSGSLGAMKAAAENFLAALTTGGNVSETMSTLLTSTGTFIFGNLVPMLGNMVTALPSAIGQALQTAAQTIVAEAPNVLNALKTGIETNVPILIASGQNIITSIKDGIMQNAPVLYEQVKTVVMDIGAKIVENFPLMVEKGRELLTSVSQGIVENLPNMAQSAVEIINSIGSYIVENLPAIGEKGAQLLEYLGKTLVENIPVVVGAIWDAAPVVLQAVFDIGTSIIKNLVKIIPQVQKTGIQMISGLAKGIGGSALGLVKSAMEKIRSSMEEPIQKAKDTLSGIIEGIKGFFPISIGDIFNNISLPHFTVDGGQFPYGVGGKGYMPSFGVEWYAKAMDTPYMFGKPTLFGAGEAGDEIMYGRGALMRDIREATQGGSTTNVYVTVNGAESPEDWARRFAKEFKLQTRTA